MPYQRPGYNCWIPNKDSQQYKDLIAWWPLQEEGYLCLDMIHRQAVKLLRMNPSRIDNILGPMKNWNGTGGAGGSAGETPTFSTSHAMYTITGSFSISAWVNLTAVGVDRAIVSHRSAAGGSNGTYYLAMGATSTPYFGFYSGTWRSVAGLNALSTLKTYFLLGTFDENTNTAKIYVNGMLDNTGTITFALTGALMPVFLGYGYNSLGNPNEVLNGCIADVRIYNRALSSADAYNMYAPATRWELYAPVTRRKYFTLTTPAAVTRAFAGGNGSVSVSGKGAVAFS